MNLLINKFLDRKIRCGVTRGILGNHIDENVYKDLAWAARQAEVFDFGKLHLTSAENAINTYVIPELTEDEEEWFDLGLIPFPAPFCVFEHMLGKQREALLIDASVPKILRVTCIREHTADGIWVKYPGTGPDHVDKKVLGVSPSGVPVAQRTTIKSVVSKHVSDYVLGSPQKIFPLHTASVPSIAASSFKNTTKEIFPSGVPVAKSGHIYIPPGQSANLWTSSPDDKGFTSKDGFDLNSPLLAGHISLAQYLTLMLNSRTTKIRPSDPVPEKLAAARRRNMKSEIRPYHIVTIVPEQYLHEGPRSPGNGLGAPRCLHWRRSHLRRYEHATPRSKWLDDPGYREPGYYAVIPRQLIGKRDMAEVVPHTYRVKVQA